MFTSSGARPAGGRRASQHSDSRHEVRQSSPLRVRTQASTPQSVRLQGARSGTPGAAGAAPESGAVHAAHSLEWALAALAGNEVTSRPSWGTPPEAIASDDEPESVTPPDSPLNYAQLPCDGDEENKADDQLAMQVKLDQHSAKPKSAGKMDKEKSRHQAGGDNKRLVSTPLSTPLSTPPPGPVATSTSPATTPPRTPSTLASRSPDVLAADSSGNSPLHRCATHIGGLNSAGGPTLKMQFGAAQQLARMDSGAISQRNLAGLTPFEILQKRAPESFDTAASRTWLLANFPKPAPSTAASGVYGEHHAAEAGNARLDAAGAGDGHRVDGGAGEHDVADAQGLAKFIGQASGVAQGVQRVAKDD